MAIKITLESFLAVLRRSNLIEAEQIKRLTDEFRAANGEPADAKPFADFLVQQKQITSWQADKLLMGKHKGFFLGRYKLKGLLGKGGMSSVYLAEHVLMRRMCALKVLPARRVNDASYLGRFHREAQAVAALDHPNIVRAYDVDHEVDGEFEIHFLVMEYVEGKSLLDLVAEKGVARPADAAEYIRQAALGLDHAHHAGIIHRDIKPGNLLLDNNGTIKLLDMGLARFFGGEDKESLTIQHDEKVLGTADYLAPEQAVDSHKVDRRADVYSLGCSLYFLLTGHPPFNTGSLAQRLMAHQMKEPPPVTAERSDVPEPLLAIMKKMMAKQLEQRYATAGEAADALGDWLATQGFAVARVSDSGRLRVAESPAAAEPAAPPAATPTPAAPPSPPAAAAPATATPPPTPAPPAPAPVDEDVPAFLNFGGAPAAESAPVEFPNFFDQPATSAASAPVAPKPAALPAKGAPAAKAPPPAKPAAKAAPAAPPKVAPAKAAPKPSPAAPAPAEDVPAFLNFGGDAPAEESSGFPQLFDDPAPAPTAAATPAPPKPAPPKSSPAPAKVPAAASEEVPAFLAVGSAAVDEPAGFPSMFEDVAPPAAPSPPPSRPAPAAKAPAKPNPPPAAAPPAPVDDVPDFLNFGGAAPVAAEETGGMPDLFGTAAAAPPPATPTKPAAKPAAAPPKAAPAAQKAPAKAAPASPKGADEDVPAFLQGGAAAPADGGGLPDFLSAASAPPPPAAAKPAPKPAAPPKAAAPKAAPAKAAPQARPAPKPAAPAPPPAGDVPAFLAASGNGAAETSSEPAVGDLFGFGTPAEAAPSPPVAPLAPAPAKPAPAKPAAAKAPSAAEEIPAFLGRDDAPPAADGGMGDLFGIGAEPPAAAAPPPPPVATPPKAKPAPPKPAAKPVVAAAAPATEELPFFAQQESPPAAGDDPFGFGDQGTSSPAAAEAAAEEESNPFASAPAAAASTPAAAPEQEVPGFLAAASDGPDDSNPFAMGETAAVATAPPRTTTTASRPLKTGTGARGNLVAEVQAWLQVKRNQAIAGGGAASLLVLILAVAFWPKGSAAPGKGTAAGNPAAAAGGGGDLPAAAKAAGAVARPKPQGDTYTVGPTGNFGTVTEAVSYFMRNAPPDGARRTIRVTGGYWYAESIKVGGVGISSPLTIMSEGDKPAVLRPAGNNPILNIPLATGLVLENIVFDANGTQVCGQIESLGTGSRLSNVEFKNFRDFGLVVTSVPGDAMQPVQIENCRFAGRDAAAKGLVFKTAPDNLFGLTIHQCQFQAPMRTGIEFGSHAIWNVTISQCRFVDVKTGLSFPAAKQDIADLHILNNTFYRSQDGIVFNQAPAGNAQGMQSAVIGNLFASTATGGGDLIVREGLTAPVWDSFTKGGPGVAGNMTQREAELGNLEVDIFSTGGGKRGLKELGFESTTPGAAGFLKPTGPQVTFPAPKAGQPYAGAVQP